MIKKVILCILLTITCTSNVLALPIITNNVPDIDSDKITNLMISFTDEDDNPLDNASFSIYKIASVSGKGVFKKKYLFILNGMIMILINIMKVKLIQMVKQSLKI